MTFALSKASVTLVSSLSLVSQTWLHLSCMMMKTFFGTSLLLVWWLRQFQLPTSERELEVQLLVLCTHLWRQENPDDVLISNPNHGRFSWQFSLAVSGDHGKKTKLPVFESLSRILTHVWPNSLLLVILLRHYPPSVIFLCWLCLLPLHHASISLK